MSAFVLASRRAPLGPIVVVTRDSPVGQLTLVAGADGLLLCAFGDARSATMRLVAGGIAVPATPATAPATPATVPASTDASAGTRDASAVLPEGDPARAGARWVALADGQLSEYFAGQRQAFTVPVDLRMVPRFDRQVLAGLSAVEFGTTVTYGALAEAVGLPVSAARGVGGAMARNPVAIIVPCHRIVGANGSLVGYGGGLSNKKVLLDLEAHGRPAIGADGAETGQLALGF